MNIPYGTYRIEWTFSTGGGVTGLLNAERLGASLRNRLNNNGVNVLVHPTVRIVDRPIVDDVCKVAVGVDVTRPIDTTTLDTAFWNAARDGGVGDISVNGLVGALAGGGLSATGGGPGWSPFRPFRDIQRFVTSVTRAQAATPQLPTQGVAGGTIVGSSNAAEIGVVQPNALPTIREALNAGSDALGIGLGTKVTVGVGLGVVVIVAVGYAVRSFK